MDTIHFPYRSSRHLGLLHVIGESGSWEKHDLRVEYDYWISSEDAHQAIAEGSVEFVGGNHISPYAARTRGDRWVYVGQTQNVFPHKLIVREDSGIDSVDDLRGKTIGGIGTGHPSLTTGLYLKQHGLDPEQGEVTLKKTEARPTWQAVKDGEVDATFVTAPGDLLARKAGLKVVAIDLMPMIEFTSLSTSLTFVERHPDIVERFVKGVVEGIAFFKTRKAETLDIMRRKYSARGELDDEGAEWLYEELASTLESKPYPRLRAVDNVYELALQQDEAAAQVEPLSLWDTHFVRSLDDSGFIDALYPAR